MQSCKKIVLLGHHNVGKTSLVRRFVHQTFSSEYISTIGVTLEKKDVSIGNIAFTMIIWDIAGEALLEVVPQSYLMGSQGIIYVFDLHRKTSWENLEQQISFLEEHYPLVPIKIVGNKADLVSNEEIAAIKAKNSRFEIYTSSAKTGDNVDLIFKELAESFII